MKLKFNKNAKIIMRQQEQVVLSKKTI